MKRLLVIILVIVVLVSVSIIYFLLPSNETVKFNSENKTLFIVEGTIANDVPEPFIENDFILLPLSAIQKYVDPKVYWEEDTQKIIFTTNNKLIKMKTDSLTAMVNSNPVDLNIPVKIINDIPYIPIEFLSDAFEIKVSYIQETNVVILDYDEAYERIIQVIDENGKIRTKPSIKSPILVESLKTEEKVRAFEEYEKWYKVRTDNGIIGYIEKKYVKLVYETTKKFANNYVPPTWTPIKGKINLVWDYIYKQTPDMSNVEKIEGLDIISPTWFEVVDGEGNINNKATKEYVEWAHAKGYKVWALVTNSFDPDITNVFLNNSDTREKIINQLLIYANLYGFDGINIDFENVYLKDKNSLTQFVREFYPLAKQQELVLSMDVSVMGGSETWSLCYDRKALAESLDYVCFMTYDQHWAASPVAGSVAELSWVENNLKKVLTEVPAEKLLLGLPFYTRLWEEKNEGEAIEVSSTALSMEAAENIVVNQNIDKVWDEDSSQYYAEYIENGNTYKVWIEDAKSINLKASLVHKYNLAGVASWRKGFETNDIWDTLNETLKEYSNYTQWAKANGYEDKIFN
jgi:spore germination protein YaaH